MKAEQWRSKLGSMDHERPPPPPPAVITEIAAEIGRTPGTVKRFSQGKKCASTTEHACAAAFQRRGLPLPPQHGAGR